MFRWLRARPCFVYVQTVLVMFRWFWARLWFVVYTLRMSMMLNPCVGLGSLHQAGPHVNGQSLLQFLPVRVCHPKGSCFLPQSYCNIMHLLIDQYYLEKKKKIRFRVVFK